MNLPRVQREMQEDRLWSLCPAQDIDAVLDNRYSGSHSTFSLPYFDLYLRQFKETLKQTMLEQESVFENQIHELHRLYQRQKDLMMEMGETNNSYGQFLNPGVCSPRRSMHSMDSSISISKTSVLPIDEDASAKINEAVFSGDESEKSGEKVVDLELPSYGYLDVGEDEGSKNGEVLDFPKDYSPRRVSLEPVVQPENVHHLTGLPSFDYLLDLNEPARIEEHSDYELNQFLSPAQTRSEPEAQDTRKSTKTQAENGFDLNMSPLSSQEEVTIFKTIESEQPRELISASLHGSGGPSRVIVQALPCLKTIPLFHNPSKSSTRKPWSKKKGKRGAKSTKSRKGSNLDLNVGVNEDENLPLSIASHIPESDQNQEHVEKGSLPKVESARNWTNTGKRRRKSGKVTRGSFVVTEEENQEKSAAAEAIVDMSLSDSTGKSSVETSDCITPLRWFAKIASSVVEDSKSEVGFSLTGFHTDYDYFEAMTLQIAETKPEEQSVSNIVPAKHKRTRRSQGKRQQQQQQQHKDCENEFLPRNEASQDLNKIERLIEASETNDAHCCLMKNMVIDWGTIRKRRRGNRIGVTNTNTFIAFLRNQSYIS